MEKNTEEEGNEYVDRSADDESEAQRLNALLTVPEECKSESEVWRVAMENGILIKNFKELEEAIENLKSEITRSIYYDGPTEVIHDNNIIEERLNLIGLIGKGLKTYIDTKEWVVDDKASKFLEQLNTIKSLIDASSPESRELLAEIIRMHFHCFKNCNNTECLSFV